MRKKFLTPPTLPAGSQCRGLDVPASKEWLGIFSNALLETTYAHNYEQVNETDLTPEEVADTAYQAYLAWLDSTCGGEAGPPTVVVADGTTQRIHRTNPTTGRWEVLNSDGTWSEPTGDDAIPEPDARAESTDAEKICAAASNAAHVVRLTYESFLDDINNEIDEQQMQVNLAVSIGIGLAGALFPPAAAEIAIDLGAFNGFLEVGQSLLANLWSDDFHQRYVCCLNDHAVVSAGKVYFNFWDVNKCLLEQIWTSGDYILLIGQILYLHGLIGAQGLNIAGATTGVAGACGKCGRWARRFNFATGPAGWAPTVSESAWNSGGWWQSTSGSNRSIIDMSINPLTNTSFTIQRIKISGYVPSGALPLAADRTFSSNSPAHTKTITMAVGNWTFDSEAGGDLGWNDLSTAALKVRLYASGTIQLWRIYEIIIWGTGANVWGTNQGEDYYGV